MRASRPADRPLVVSHRANTGAAPENTIAGIEAAIAAGCDAIEVDVRATRDGALVLMHDRTLQRATGDPRPLVEVTLAELRELRVLDAGERVEPQPIPTLEDALAAIGGRCAIELDLPVRGLEPSLVETVRRHDAEGWTWFTVHPPEDAEYLRGRCPGATVLLSVDAQSRYTRDLAAAVEVAESLGLDGINAAHSALSADLVRDAHQRGLEVGCWTVNERSEINRALLLDVDALTTDHPQEAFELIEARRS